MSERREPWWTDGVVELWVGDALQVLQAFPDESVDLVLTDPPYCSGGQFRSDRIQPTTEKYAATAGQGFGGDSRDQRSFVLWSSLWLGRCHALARPGSVCAVFTDWRQLPSMTDALQAGGWVWRGIAVWHKPAHRPTGEGKFDNECEFVVWGTKGPRKAEPWMRCMRGAWSQSAPRARDHQTEKPLGVLAAICEACPPGGTVLDPFAGSGSALVAARSRGLRAVGVEIDEAFAERTRSRLELAGAVAAREGAGAP